MDIEALLNPVEESQTMDAVLEVKKACELSEVNHGDDDPEDDAPIVPHLLGCINHQLVYL